MSETGEDFGAVSKTLTAKEIAQEVYEVGLDNDIPPKKVIIFGSYAKGEQTAKSDADVVVISSEIDEDDYYARNYYWDWDWDYDKFPTLDLIVLRPKEFEEYKNRDGHIVHEASKTGKEFKF